MAYRRRQVVTRESTFKEQLNHDTLDNDDDNNNTINNNDADSKLNKNLNHNYTFPGINNHNNDENGSLAARAIRASAAHRDTAGYGYAYASPSLEPSSSSYSSFSSRRADHFRSPPLSKGSFPSESTSIKDPNDPKYGFWGILARKAKSILDEDDEFESTNRMRSTMNTASGNQFLYSRRPSESGSRIDNAKFRKGIDAITSSLNNLGGTLGNAFESYIVYMGAHSHGPDATAENFNQVESTHHNFLASFLGSHKEAKDAIFYSYKMHINGFAANLDEDQASEIAKHPEVISVFPNRGKKLHTTHSWDFLMLENDGETRPHSAWKKANYGENTIIANLDTGVWPESKSFHDHGYGPIPSKWKGFCDIEGVPCNRKLLGARFFNKGYAAFVGKSDPAWDTARDYDGHGSHTLSTAGGNFVPGAKIMNITSGVAKGGSPKARVAAYKVCWKPVNESGCFDADILAAFDTAIHDGVDVLSVSLGGDPTDYFKDGIAIGAFHAVQNGIVVVLSAGNSGPGLGTVSNLAPWMITVGASTMDRQFESYVELGNRDRFQGSSLSGDLPEKQLYQLITGAQAKTANATANEAMLCQPNTLDEKKAKGKIVVCLRGENGRVNKGVQVALAGAAGMILCNDESTGNEIISDPHVLPATHITYKDGLAVFAYVNSTRNAYGFITKPQAVLQTKPAPYVAAFSSRGPNLITPEILKPDITAPGVNVIAAYSEGVSPTDEDFDKRRFPYMVDSGTSMSCPHISGIVGLLKTRYPNWSPAAIKSAIMTTARVKDNTGSLMKDATFEKVNPFSYGSGHVQPNRAMNPGLVYDLGTSDYLGFLCNLGYNETTIKAFVGKSSYECPKLVSEANVLNLNYPSITVPKLSKSVTITRKVKNVGSPGTYVASVGLLKGVSVRVVPEVLDFKKVGEVKSFSVTLTPKKGGGLKKGEYVFGHLAWTDGKHHVRSPIAVAAPAPAV